MEKIAIVLVVVMVILGGAKANGQMICNMTVAGLMSCKPAATAPNPPAPTGECCSALSHADMKCLCSYKDSKVLPSLGIDPDLAMQLPHKCKIPNPPKC